MPYDLTKVTSTINIPLSLWSSLYDPRLRHMTEKEVEDNVTTVRNQVSQSLHKNGSKGLALMFEQATRKGDGLTIKPTTPRTLPLDPWTQREFYCSMNGAKLFRASTRMPASVRAYSCFKNNPNDHDGWSNESYQGKIIVPSGEHPDTLGRYTGNPRFRISNESNGVDPVFVGPTTAQLSMDLSINGAGITDGLDRGVEGLRLHFVQQLDQETAQVEASCFLSREAGTPALWAAKGLMPPG